MRSLKKLIGVLILVGLLWVAAGCDSLPISVGNKQPEGISASGVVEATDVMVASEFGGRVAEVFVAAGDLVDEGEPLFRLEDELLQAQRKQAEAAYGVAQANLAGARSALELARAQLQAAQVGLQSAQIQFEVERDLARMEEGPIRADSWKEELSKDFDTPPWYFSKTDQIAAAQAAVVAAKKSLDNEQQSYDKLLQDSGNADLLAAEQRLAESQAAFLVAEALKDRDIASQDKKTIDDSVNEVYDAAEAELESAQKELDRILSEKDSKEMLEAKARLSVARERYEISLDQLRVLSTGDQSLQVRAAAMGVDQAQTGVVQAEALVAQAQTGVQQAEETLEHAQATLDLIDVQIAKLTVHAAVAGVVAVRNVQPGEILGPGVAALTISQLDDLKVTVYIPEDRYGQINVGDVAQMVVDSFPGRIFEAQVIRIADQAEYTPRNVQTQEERSTTVFAIELSVDDPQGNLKPGMPADIIFAK